MRVLSNALKVNNYDAEPLLKSCGISISSNFTQVEGRVLPAPRLKVGNGEDFFPRNGRWNFNNKKFVNPATIEKWAVANFSARCDIRNLVRDLIKCGGLKGIKIEEPFDVFEESPQNRRAPPLVRVEKMFDFIQSKLPGAPQFLLCLLPERKNSDLYVSGRFWNRDTVLYCSHAVNDEYLTNVLLKINANLGGLNSMLAIEHSPSIPVVSKAPHNILGMDVSHGSPGQSDVPSIAAVVSSRHYPLISRYRASVRTQSPKVEMIDSLFKKVSDTEDDGIMRELLLDFYVSSAKRKPDQIIIFRDGVSESQFNQVLNIELDQIIEACKFLDEKWCPKFLVIIAQKNHHTKFFQPGSPDNVPPGTVIDNKVCHPRNNDFYMCAHAGMIGTTRPTHYHVLYDEIGFSADDLQELVHSLSYVYQRSTTAISVGGTGVTSAGAVPVPQLPKLQEKVTSSMFFC
ncbi:argonaute 4-like protein [Tanacetum coccineum]